MGVLHKNEGKTNIFQPKIFHKKKKKIHLIFTFLNMGKKSWFFLNILISFYSYRLVYTFINREAVNHMLYYINITFHFWSTYVTTSTRQNSLKVTDCPGAKEIKLIKQGYNYQRKATNQLMKSILLKFKVVKVFPNKVLMAPNRPVNLLSRLTKLFLYQSKPIK